MDMSDERKAFEKYVEVIDVTEITEYDEESLGVLLEFLNGASRLVAGEWEWTAEGERLWNMPSVFFWKLWRAAKEKVRAFGFHPRPDMKGDEKVWFLYFHVEEFFSLSVEDVREIDWDLDGSTFASQGDPIHHHREALPFASEVQEPSARRDFPFNDAQKARILNILEDMHFLVVSEWRWKANGQSLWNYPSESCLRLWEMAPELLRERDFYVFSKCEGDEKTCILYFNISDTFRKYVLSGTSLE